MSYNFFTEKQQIYIFFEHPLCYNCQPKAPVSVYQGCRSRPFWLEPEPFFGPAPAPAPAPTLTHRTVNILFLRDPKYDNDYDLTMTMTTTMTVTMIMTMTMTMTVTMTVTMTMTMTMI